MSWLKRTNQKWKVYTLLGMVYLTFAAMINFILSVEDDNKFLLNMMLFLVSFVALIYFLVFSVRCPSCNKTVVYKAMCDSTLSTWLVHLMTFEKCPQCGADGNNHTND